MPVRQGNQRETASQKGSDYSDAIIEFQKQRGYFLDARAEDSGEGEDLVFVPKASNRPRVVAEAKYRSPNKGGLSPNNYVEDFAKRFYQWEDGCYRGYEFHLFASQSSNPSLWKDLFERLKDDVVESFFKKMKNQSEGMYQQFLEQHQPSGFKRFLENSYIWIDYGIGDFKRIVDRVDDTGEYNYDPYSINYNPVEESGLHKTNLLELVEIPSQLYKIPTAEGTTTKKFYAHDGSDILPVHYHNNQIYSLVHPDEFDERLRNMCKNGSFDTTKFSEFATEDPTETQIDISKVLVRGVVTTIADRIGAEVNRNRGSTRIYMEHDDEDIQRQGKWVTKELETGEVRHRSVIAFVKFFGSKYFVGLHPTTEFTTDGKSLVSGGRKKHLSNRFNPAKFPQNSRKSNTVEIWLSELALEESLTRFKLYENLQNIRLSRTEDIVLDGLRPPKSGTERNDLIERHLDGSIDIGDQK